MIHHVIIEPHADDAYLSLHNHICRWRIDGDSVTIVTVFSGDRKRGADAYNYATAVKVDSLLLGYKEEVDRALKFKPESLRNPFDYEEELDVILPLGIQNEQHKLVREQLSVESCRFYAEIPYYNKKKNNEEFLGLCESMSISSMMPGGGRKGNDSYWKCFKDQSKFFFYNPPASYQGLPELILKKL